MRWDGTGSTSFSAMTTAPARGTRYFNIGKSSVVPRGSAGRISANWPALFDAKTDEIPDRGFYNRSIIIT